MQVNIKFDTEKESVDDLKRLINSLQELVAQREKITTIPKPMQSFVSQPQTPIQAPVQPQAPKPTSGQTAGGGKIMDYDPAIGDLLSKFASGSKY